MEKQKESNLIHVLFGKEIDLHCIPQDVLWELTADASLPDSKWNKNGNVSDKWISKMMDLLFAAQEKDPDANPFLDLPKVNSNPTVHWSKTMCDATIKNTNDIIEKHRIKDYATYRPNNYAYKKSIDWATAAVWFVMVPIVIGSCAGLLIALIRR